MLAKTFTASGRENRQGGFSFQNLDNDGLLRPANASAKPKLFFSVEWISRS